MRAVAVAAAVAILAGCGSAPEPVPAMPAATAAGPEEGGPASRAPTPAVPSAPAAPGVRVYDFEGDAIGAPPRGFFFARTGEGQPGRWIVAHEAGEGGGSFVLQQDDTDPTDFRFPLAVADAAPLRDVRVSVRCRMLMGSVDRAAGLVFRYRDADNYYLTRANALEGNVRLYWVKEGRRQEIASWKGKVDSGAWHEYAVEARGDSIVVYWDGAPVLDTRDSTFREAGAAGVWTKADSLTLFDDLRVEPLGE